MLAPMKKVFTNFQGLRSLKTWLPIKKVNPSVSYTCLPTRSSPHQNPHICNVSVASRSQQMWLPIKKVHPSYYDARVSNTRMFSSHSSPHQNPDIQNAPVAIFYHLDSCPAPDMQEIDNNIRKALEAHQIRGQIVQQHVFGDRISQSTMEELGPNFRWLFGHPRESIIVDMFCFTFDNPPPACIVLISGDDIFSDALHRLSMRGYTVILAIPSTVSVSSPLRYAGRFVWEWPSLSETSTSFTANPDTSDENASDGSVAVLWDMESCPVPSDISVEAITGQIRTALYIHPLSGGSVARISAYRHFQRFSESVKEELQRVKVQCMDVPNGVDPFFNILVDTLSFALDNPRPACLMVITGNEDFCHVLNRLGLFGYTVLLAIPSGVGVSSLLRHTGRFRWDWPSLSRLE